MIADQWRQLGKALSQNAEDLEQIYHTLEGELELEQISASWQFLAEHGIVLGNLHSGYSASSVLLQLGDILALTEHQQVQAPDVTEWRENLKRLVSRFTLLSRSMMKLVCFQQNAKYTPMF